LALGTKGKQVSVVLVVEDDPGVRELLRIVLEDAGYDVHEAADGAEALRQVSAVRPDLILLDLYMPQMNGWTFVPAFHLLPGPHAPVVVMTVDGDGATHAARLGAAACLLKPFDVADLLTVGGRVTAVGNGPAMS